MTTIKKRHEIYDERAKAIGAHLSFVQYSRKYGILKGILFPYKKYVFPLVRKTNMKYFIFWVKDEDIDLWGQWLNTNDYYVNKYFFSIKIFIALFLNFLLFFPLLIIALLPILYLFVYIVVDLWFEFIF